MTPPITRAVQVGPPGQPHIFVSGLSPLGDRLLVALARAFDTWVSHNQLVEALYSDDPEGGPLNTYTALKQVTEHLERRLDDTALAVETKGGTRRLKWRST